MRLTGMQQTEAAIRELNSFIAEAWLEKHGAGRTVVYMLSRK